MNDKKWVVTDNPVPKPQNFPWGTLGTLIIIAFSCVMISVITFFVYSGKSERSLANLNRKTLENQSLQMELEKLQDKNNDLELQIKESKLKLLEVDNNRTPQN